MKHASVLQILTTLFLTLSPLFAHALLADEPWARKVMAYKDDRFELITCGSTFGPRKFANPLPMTQYFCIARPSPFDGRSILLHQDKRKNWQHFEIFNCKRSESAVSGAAGYLKEACEIVELNPTSLKRAGPPVPLTIRTEWDEQVGGLMFHFRHRGQVYNGMPMNLYELHQLNR